jgi:hypothetical protein
VTVHRALDLLFMKHPLRTSLGVVLGLVITLLTELFVPLLSKSRYVDVSRVAKTLWVALGILIMHIPTITYMFRGVSANESVEDPYGLSAKHRLRRLNGALTIGRSSLPLCTTLQCARPRRRKLRECGKTSIRRTRSHRTQRRRFHLGRKSTRILRLKIDTGERHRFNALRQ